MPERYAFSGLGLALLLWAAVAAPTSRAAPGEVEEIQLEWQLNRLPPDRRPGVFVHFMHGNTIRFQADYALLDNWSASDLSQYPRSARFTQTVRFKIPDDAPSGEYTIRMGLYDVERNKRYRPSTTLPQRKRAFTLPIPFTVESATTSARPDAASSPSRYFSLCQISPSP